MLLCRAGLVRDHEAGADGHRLGRVVAGSNSGGDLLHAPSLQPGDHSDRSFGGEALALPGHAHEPRELGRPATAADHRLEHSDRHPVNQPANNPIELGCGIGGAVFGELAKGISQTLDSPGLSTGEQIQPFVGEDRGQLVSVAGGNRHKDKPSGPDTVIDRCRLVTRFSWPHIAEYAFHGGACIDAD
jgi:hypothetical protein